MELLLLLLLLLLQEEARLGLFGSTPLNRDTETRAGGEGMKGWRGELELEEERREGDAATAPHGHAPSLPHASHPASRSVRDAAFAEERACDRLSRREVRHVRWGSRPTASRVTARVCGE
ncbi:unnamed protein product [Lampetra fluviatilis]